MTKVKHYQRKCYCWHWHYCQWNLRFDAEESLKNRSAATSGFQISEISKSHWNRYYISTWI